LLFAPIRPTVAGTGADCREVTPILVVAFFEEYVDKPPGFRGSFYSEDKEKKSWDSLTRRHELALAFDHVFVYFVSQRHEKRPVSIYSAGVFQPTDAGLGPNPGNTADVLG
jgi:hypothetical protein